MSETLVTGEIGNCFVCSQRLPLRLPKPGEPGVEWMCTNCSSVCYAVLVETAPEDQKANVRSARFRFNEDELPPPPPMLEPYVLRMARTAVRGNDQRDSVRRPFVTTVPTMPLDDYLHPADEPFRSVTKDISASGLCLFSHRCIETDFLALQLPSSESLKKNIQIVVQIARRTPIGIGYELAGPFVTRLANED